MWFENADASDIWIESEDSTVPVESEFDGSVVRAIRFYGPVLNCLIHVGDTGDGQSGYAAEVGSVGFVEAGSGVINTPDRGLRAHQNLTVYAPFGVNFDGAGNFGLQAEHASLAYVRQGSFNEASNRGIFVNDASFVDAKSATITGATEVNLYAHHGCLVNITSADLSDGDRWNLEIRDGCFGSGGGGTFNNSADRGVHALASIIMMSEATINDADERVIVSTAGPHLNAHDATITNASDEGALATRGSKVNFESATVTGSGSNDIAVEEGCIATANNCETSSTGSDPHEDDVSPAGAINSVDPSGILFGNFET